MYALKTLRSNYLKDEATNKRFRKEANVWINLERHPYIVQAYYIEESYQDLFIVMEHIAPNEHGLNSLEKYLRICPPSLTQSLRWAIQFCHGMEHAYSKGVKAHRDIKPANIMIDLNKTVKITDFGLAGIFQASSKSEQGKVSGKAGSDSLMQTAIGTSIGTPEYMSPEQFEDLSACDERSDIYSFGIVLYQMASGGRLPFSADNPALRWSALKLFHCETPVPKLNTSLFPVIQKCLEKKPSQRYQAFKEARKELEVLLKKVDGEIVEAPSFDKLKVWEWSNKGASLCTLTK